MDNQLAISVFLTGGLFLGLFVFWRKVRYDSKYEEKEAVDGFLTSLFLGWLAGRATFIVSNFDSFGWQPLNWLNFWSYPGIIEIVALIISGWYLFGWCNRHRFDNWQILDFWVTAASLTLVIYEVGQFISGTGFGYETTLPWGFAYPGAVTPHHPVQLYLALFYCLLFLYLVKTEYNYRTYDWYRNSRSAAVPGFLVSISMIAFGLAGCLISFFRSPQWQIGWFNFDFCLNFIILIWGMRILWVRSGRKLNLEKATENDHDQSSLQPTPIINTKSGIEEIELVTISEDLEKKTEKKPANKLNIRKLTQISTVKSPTRIKKKITPTKFKMK